MHDWVDVASDAFAAIFHEAEQPFLAAGRSFARARTIK
jgi:hypothetical protein